jgi:hypothetical protein
MDWFKGNPPALTNPLNIPMVPLSGRFRHIVSRLLRQQSRGRRGTAQSVGRPELAIPFDKNLGWPSLTQRFFKVVHLAVFTVFTDTL